MRLARRNAPPRELIRLTPVQFSISVSVVVILLAVAGLAGYHIGRKETEKRIKTVSGKTAESTVASDPTPALSGTPAPVTFYTVLTETRDESPTPPRPETKPADTKGKEKDSKQAKDDLSFILQVASYKGREAAVSLLEKLSAEGYTGTVQVADLGERGTWYRVRIGPYGSEDKAKEVLVKLREERNLKGYIVR